MYDLFLSICVYILRKYENCLYAKLLLKNTLSRAYRSLYYNFPHNTLITYANNGASIVKGSLN